MRIAYIPSSVSTYLKRLAAGNSSNVSSFGRPSGGYALCWGLSLRPGPEEPGPPRLLPCEVAPALRVAVGPSELEPRGGPISTKPPAASRSARSLDLLDDSSWRPFSMLGFTFCVVSGFPSPECPSPCRYDSSVVNSRSKEGWARERDFGEDWGSYDVYDDSDSIHKVHAQELNGALAWP